MTARFRGSFPALITPMTETGAIDEAAMRKLVDWQIEQGSSGLVAVGTTGESPTVSAEEHKDIIALVIEQAAGRVPVIAGTGSNSTAEAVDYTTHAEKAGADAALVVVPYYNKPSQEGLYAHFRAIAQATSLPIFLYNVPGRTVADISVATVARLARDCDNIIGIKDASGDLDRPMLLALEAGEDFIQLSGNDGTAMAFNACGGVGCISVTANVAPRLCADMQAATLQGDFAAARAIQSRLMPLHEAMFCDTSPGPVKYAASLLGLCSPFARLPIVEITDEAKARVRAAMRALDLIG